MDTKKVWIEQFEGLLWKHHTCDWDLGNRFPDLPIQIAHHYFNYEKSVEKAFSRYLDNIGEK